MDPGEGANDVIMLRKANWGQIQLFAERMMWSKLF